MIKIEKLFRREDKDMSKKGKKDYSDFSNVRRMQNELIPEEFPEGGFGSSINKEEYVKVLLTNQIKNNMKSYLDKHLVLTLFMMNKETLAVKRNGKCNTPPFLLQSFLLITK